MKGINCIHEEALHIFPDLISPEIPTSIIDTLHSPDLPGPGSNSIYILINSTYYGN
jgi:hypothetical protein